MKDYRQLTTAEREQLERQGCRADNWQNVLVKDGFDPAYVSDARFSGTVKMGVFAREIEVPGGLKFHSGIYRATLHNVEVDDDCYLCNIHNYIANYRIGHDTCIENVRRWQRDSYFRPFVRIAGIYPDPIPPSSEDDRGGRQADRFLRRSASR